MVNYMPLLYKGFNMVVNSVLLCVFGVPSLWPLSAAAGILPFKGLSSRNQGDIRGGTSEGKCPDPSYLFIYLFIYKNHHVKRVI